VYLDAFRMKYLILIPTTDGKNGKIYLKIKKGRLGIEQKKRANPKVSSPILKH
jgi:hypothetical protein